MDSCAELYSILGGSPVGALEIDGGGGGPWCGRLGSHAGEQEKVAEQGSDFMKVGNGIFLFMPRILMNVLPAQMLGWGLCTDSLLTVQE